jgi:hypothetical protein
MENSQKTLDTYTIKEHKDVRKKTLDILEGIELSRNCDNKLIGVYMYRVASDYGIEVKNLFQLLSKMPSIESIIRNRAYIQNKLGLFLPTDPKVIEKRKTRRKTKRKIYGVDESDIEEDF